ncbi:hypothetical protein KBC54_04040 [Patescibacteria group bacterium]|nr:hypothetical protein [Patescibacteria group bacterium]
MPLYYHASTEHFTEIRPRYSQKFLQKGIFLTPSKKAILDSWGVYILSKREKTLRQSRNVQLQDRDTQNPDPKLGGRDSKTLYIYAINVPHAVMNATEKAYAERKQSSVDKFGLNAYAAWGWDEEVFIPAECIPSLRIEQCKKMTREEFIDWTAQYNKERVHTSELEVRTLTNNPFRRNRS